jgi:hypothetical protein
VSRDADSEFKSRLDEVIRRVEAWSYADSDAGAGVPVELAEALRWLAGSTPIPSTRARLVRAQEALDDGLSAEVVAAELYAIREELTG